MNRPAIFLFGLGGIRLFGEALQGAVRRDEQQSQPGTPFSYRFVNNIGAFLIVHQLDADQS